MLNKSTSKSDHHTNNELMSHNLIKCYVYLHESYRLN